MLQLAVYLHPRTYHMSELATEIKFVGHSRSSILL